MPVINPFRVEVAQSDLDDLNDRLDKTRWPDELPGAGWDLGIPLARVRELATCWREKFDWRAQEAALNQFPQSRLISPPTRRCTPPGRGRSPTP